MEFLKLKLEHETLSVGVDPSYGRTNKEISKDINDSENYNGNRSAEIRSSEPVQDESQLHKVLDDTRQRSPKVQPLDSASTKSKSAMPSKLMAAVAQRNAAQQSERDDDVLQDIEDDESDHDDDDHSDMDSMFSFPSALSDMSDS